MMRVKDFLYNLRKKTHLKIWRNFLAIPQSQIRVVMWVLRHGNHVTRQELFDGLTEIEFTDKRKDAKTYVYRAIRDHILIEKDGYISVANPSVFIIKIVRGNVLDSWKALSIATSVLALLFLDINPTVSFFFGVITLLIIIGWFIDDWIHTTPY